MLTLAHACLMLAYQPADNPLEDPVDAFEPEDFIDAFVSPMNYEGSDEETAVATVTKEVKEEVKVHDAGKCRPISVIYYSDFFKKNS